MYKNMKTFESMNIYVAAATMPEIEPLIEQMGKVEFKMIITGVGAPSTIFNLTKILHAEKPDLMIQAGIAGTFDKTYEPATVVAVNQDRFADLGVAENGTWKDIFDLGLADDNDAPFSNGWLINKNPRLHQLNIPTVSAITINEVTTDSTRIQQFTSKYNPAIESMEGAAFHFTCLQYDVPFIQLRAISNHIAERDKSKWSISAAIENLNKKVFQIIEQDLTNP